MILTVYKTICYYWITLVSMNGINIKFYKIYKVLIFLLEFKKVLEKYKPNFSYFWGIFGAHLKKIF